MAKRTRDIRRDIERMVRRIVRRFHPEKVSLGIAFPRIHDVELVVALLPAACRTWLAPSEQQRLTFYSVATR
jgi:hypothetical protein